MKHITFNVSEKGRDFVVGDLHGSLPLLKNFMEFCEFDPLADRMFSVGDLVDRGTDSLGCLKLLREPWFHCVKSNHEQLMEDSLTGGPTGAWWIPNGGDWFTALEKEGIDTVNELIPVVQDLPWMITVNMKGGNKFHIIHAEINAKPGEKITDADLDDEVKFKDIAGRHGLDGHSLLWGRGMFGDIFAVKLTDKCKGMHKAFLNEQGVTNFFTPGLSHIFSGHTPMHEPTTICGQTNLDTMAFAADKRSWAGLTVVEPSTGTFWKTNKAGTQEVLPVVL